MKRIKWADEGHSDDNDILPEDFQKLHNLKTKLELREKLEKLEAAYGYYRELKAAMKYNGVVLVKEHV